MAKYADNTLYPRNFRNFERNAPALNLSVNRHKFCRSFFGILFLTKNNDSVIKMGLFVHRDLPETINNIFDNRQLRLTI